jgi:hypothetical protein
MGDTEASDWDGGGGHEAGGGPVHCDPLFELDRAQNDRRRLRERRPLSMSRYLQWVGTGWGLTRRAGVDASVFCDERPADICLC